MIIIAIFVAVVIEATWEIDLITNQTKHIHAGSFDATAGLGGQIPTDLAQTDEEKYAIQFFAQQNGVGEHQTGRSVPEDYVVIG